MRALHLCALTTQEPRANICQQQNAFKPQVAYAAVLSRVVVLMLLIRCFFVTPIVGFICCSMFCCASFV